MNKKNILYCIKKLKRDVFTTREISSISGKSLSATVQALNYLQKQGLIFKIYRGIWAEITGKPLSPYSVIPFLPVQSRCYVSFISALHLHGIIEQIPQVITLASIEHTRKVSTKAGAFAFYKIQPAFFKGFNWYQKSGNFLIAQPEKALIDCLYISAYKKKQFSYFPELHFPKLFSSKKAKEWIRQIPSSRVRSYVEKKYKGLVPSTNQGDRSR
jgi:predicted transcriptional regulator of viral defense system